MKAKVDYISNVEENVTQVHFYISDPEVEVKEGDWCINDNGDTVYQVNGKTQDGWNKLISTTNESLGLPNLSRKSVDRVIDYYNQYGEWATTAEITTKGMPSEAYKREVRLNRSGRTNVFIPDKYVRDMFYQVGHTLLAKDVGITTNLDGFKRFIINGKILQNTDRLYDALAEENPVCL
jgi:hypothetical protein